MRPRPKMKETRPGPEIPPRTLTAYQRALDDSSHKDDYARTKGYQAALLSGYVLCGYLSGYFEDFFGPAWLTNGEIELAFIKAVHQKQTITIRAFQTGTEKKRNGTWGTLDFRIEQADGTVNVRGQASGMITD